LETRKYNNKERNKVVIESGFIIFGKNYYSVKNHVTHLIIASIEKENNFKKIKGN
jgi:hypothetical protein